MMRTKIDLCFMFELLHGTVKFPVIVENVEFIMYLLIVHDHVKCFVPAGKKHTYSIELFR